LMELILNSKIRVRGAPEPLKNFLLPQLKILNPKYIEAQAAGRSLWGMEQYIYNFTTMPDGSFLIPRGMRQPLVDILLEQTIPFTTVDERSLHTFHDVDSSNIIYRPYQQEAVQELVRLPEGVLVAPAGSGKTVMGLSLVPITGQPTLWLTHTKALADQAEERAKSFLPNIGEVGRIGEGKWKQGDLLTVGLIQTLVRNLEKLVQMMDDYGLVVLDEAHHCPARTFLEVVCSLNPFYLYGLTATPYRRDKLEVLMFQALGETKTVIPIDKVEAHGGIIIPTVRYKSFIQPKVQGNQIQPILKRYIVENKKRTRMIVGDVIAEAVAGNFCIVISDRKAHCEDLYNLIKLSWEKTGIATGSYSKKHVNAQVEAFENNDITVLVTTFALLGEGFDVPKLNRAFVTMPFRAEAKAEQLIGRIQRTAPGKTDAIVYDYVDTNIGVLESQFYSKYNDCRHGTYTKLGVNVEPY
jgi:superfamily II DNA or RNA helicase